MIKGFSARELGRIARGGLRRRVLAEVFGPIERQFRPGNAGSLSALIHWQITGESEAVYKAAAADGICAVTQGRTGADPRLMYFDFPKA